MRLLQIKKIGDSRGFTLVEILLVVLLIFVVVGVVSMTYITSKDVVNITTSEIDARTTMYRISKDIREALSLSIAKDDELKFLCNIDSDEDYEILDYYLIGESGYYNLYRKVDEEQGKILITHIVNNSLFEYYSGIETIGTALTTPVAEVELNNVKIIKINIDIDQEGSPSNRTMNLDTIITLRNKI
jgi:competence protein ComGC